MVETLIQATLHLFNRQLTPETSSSWSTFQDRIGRLLLGQRSPHLWYRAWKTTTARSSTPASNPSWWINSSRRWRPSTLWLCNRSREMRRLPIWEKEVIWGRMSTYGSSLSRRRLVSSSYKHHKVMAFYHKSRSTCRPIFRGAVLLIPSSSTNSRYIQTLWRSWNAKRSKTLRTIPSPLTYSKLTQVRCLHPTHLSERMTWHQTTITRSLSTTQTRYLRWWIAAKRIKSKTQPQIM